MTIPQGRLRRTAPLAALSARAAGEGVVDVLRRRLKGERGASLEFHLRNAERYADVLSRSKGVLMKAGQILSFVDTSAVLEGQYGEVYRAALAPLQADPEPMEPMLVAAAVESEVAERIGAELDDRSELGNQMAFADNYRGHPVDRVPGVLPELSSDRVGTMEMVDGRRWSAIEDVDQELRDRWGEVVERFFF